MIPAAPPPGQTHTECPSCRRPITDPMATVRGLCPWCGVSLPATGPVR